MTHPDMTLIEPRFRESLERYHNHHIQPGGFLIAVLSNDLKEAIGRADSHALDNLPHIVAYAYNALPIGIWGSPQRVASWLGRDGDAS